jgi:hypothetical protein
VRGIKPVELTDALTRSRHIDSDFVSSQQPSTPPRKQERKQTTTTKLKEVAEPGKQQLPLLEAEGRRGLRRRSVTVIGEGGGGGRRPGSAVGRAPRAAAVLRFESTERSR